jgi:hypothetical protein
MLASDHPSVATTWALSFENIEKANPAAAELLRFCAFLHPVRATVRKSGKFAGFKNRMVKWPVFVAKRINF